MPRDALRSRRSPTRPSSRPCGRCCSPWPTRCSRSPPTPRTSCRRPGCAGRASTRRRCATRGPTSCGSSSASSLNRFRTVARRRETYVGPWLPEPLVTVPDVADDVELADSVSTAMLLVLQTLTPVERAVFVLHEVFDVPYDEIAQAWTAARRPCGRSPTGRASTSPPGRPRQRVDRSEHAACSSGSGPPRPPATSARSSTSSRPTCARHRRRRRAEGGAAADHGAGQGAALPRGGHAAGTSTSSCGSARRGSARPRRRARRRRRQRHHATPWTGWSARSTSSATPTSSTRLGSEVRLAR